MSHSNLNPKEDITLQWHKHLTSQQQNCADDCYLAGEVFRDDGQQSIEQEQEKIDTQRTQEEVTPCSRK